MEFTLLRGNYHAGSCLGLLVPMKFNYKATEHCKDNLDNNVLPNLGVMARCPHSFDHIVY